MLDLYKKYYNWIDRSIYEGKSLEECEELQEENKKKYGLNHVLRKDAPPEAVAAWEEDCRQTREADAEGLILN